jgi:hypothetical protein
MGVFSSLKDFFMPSEEVSAARRLQTFGSESKVKAGAIILGSAAAAIAAPAVLGSAAVKQATVAAVKNVGTKFAAAKLTTQAAVVGGTLLATGALIREPAAVSKVVAKTPGKILDLGGDIAQFAVDPSIEKAKEFVIEHPVATAGTGVALLGAVGVGVAGVLSTIATRQNTAAVLEGTKTANQLLTTDIIPKSKGAADTVLTSTLSDQPLTTIYPEGKGISASTKRHKRHKSLLPSPIFRNIFKPVMIQVNRNG